MNKKFIGSKRITDYEVLTDSGWENINAIHKTIEYEVYHLKTDKHELLCADNHIVFKGKKEIFVKDLKAGDYIESFKGPSEVLKIVKTGKFQNMYDLELSDDSNKCYFTNGILSHNTTYIRYLAGKLKRNIIFISPDMVHSITAPEFIPFLLDNSNAILIIEDAEPAIQSRSGNERNGAVSNILNMTDGLLSDCLNISIVATFNTSTKDIDKALLRPGRLLKAYKFDKLEVGKSQALMAKIGKVAEVKKPMSLADIYFYGLDNRSSEFQHIKPGF
jgi:hypothetical protein